MDDLTEVYNELIMEHSMNSYNKKKLENADYCEIGHNPNCGDEITLELKVNGDVIEDMAFSGHGCAISQASTSIMIDTLKGKTIKEAKEIVKTFIETTGLPGALLPALVFILAAFLSFATGTSWGTFGILIPIIIPVAQSICPELLLSSLAATLAGSVFGDHCSPISDTTILSSAGAGVNHLTHVSTQMIYALTVAGCSLIGYLIIGITNGNLLLSLGTSIFILCIFTFIMHRRSKTILNKKDICSTQQDPMLSL